MIGRRVRTPQGEIDLVAVDGGTLVVVEVKSSRSGEGGRHIADRVDHRKRLRLTGAARCIARSAGLAGLPIRFDVVVVRLAGWRPACTILRQAFLGSGR